MLCVLRSGGSEGRCYCVCVCVRTTYDYKRVGRSGKRTCAPPLFFPSMMGMCMVVNKSQWESVTRKRSEEPSRAATVGGAGLELDRELASSTTSSEGRTGLLKVKVNVGGGMQEIAVWRAG